MNSMRPVRTIAAALLVASIAVAGCSTRDTSPPGDAARSIAAPATPAPDQPISDQPAPRSPVNRPPSTAEAVATAVSFMGSGTMVEPHALTIAESDHNTRSAKSRRYP
jgi:hypothetical protein